MQSFEHTSLRLEERVVLLRPQRNPNPAELMELRKRHGKHKQPEYIRWWNMMNRCYNKSHDKFQYYGGRGISVCERWHDYHMFIWDAFPIPNKHVLDRIENNLGYSPQNCRWVSRSQSMRNTRRSAKVKINGIEFGSIADAAEYIGISRQTMWLRHKTGVDLGKRPLER